jgi:hypothetical protein
MREGELLRQIDGLNSTDEAALWAQRRLVAKNQTGLFEIQAEHRRD